MYGHSLAQLFQGDHHRGGEIQIRLEVQVFFRELNWAAMKQSQTAPASA
jgi:hypothetical protein